MCARIFSATASARRGAAASRAARARASGSGMPGLSRSARNSSRMADSAAARAAAGRSGIGTYLREEEHVSGADAVRLLAGQHVALQRVDICLAGAPGQLKPGARGEIRAADR